MGRSRSRSRSRDRANGGRRSRSRSHRRSRSRDRRSRSRSREREVDPVRKEWNLKYVEATGERLERHEGARRQMQPAWMAKGVGVGKEMFGEVGSGENELLKPGLTKAKLAELESAPKDTTGPDPFGDAYRESQGEKVEAASPETSDGEGAPKKSWRQSGPLPSQDEIFAKSSPSP